MDYKYIEQLLERYWRCETSLEEEEILRLFFRQQEVPAALAQYKDFFDYEQQERDVQLGDDFDAKILSMIEEQSAASQPKVVQAHHITFVSRLMPLMKAVAVVAVLFTIGNVAQRTMNTGNAQDADTYVDTYTDPEAACDQVNSALDVVSEALRMEHATDSIFPVSTTDTDDVELNESIGNGSDDVEKM